MTSGTRLPPPSTLTGGDTGASSAFFVCLAAFVAVAPLGSKSNPKVIFLEEVSADPVGALESVFAFLGIDPLSGEGPGLSVDWEKVVRTSHNLTGSARKSILGVQVRRGNHTIFSYIGRALFYQIPNLENVPKTWKRPLRIFRPRVLFKILKFWHSNIGILLWAPQTAVRSVFFWFQKIGNLH